MSTGSELARNIKESGDARHVVAAIGKLQREHEKQVKQVVRIMQQTLHRQAKEMQELKQALKQKYMVESCQQRQGQESQVGSIDCAKEHQSDASISDVEVHLGRACEVTAPQQDAVDAEVRRVLDVLGDDVDVVALRTLIESGVDAPSIIEGHFQTPLSTTSSPVTSTQHEGPQRSLSLPASTTSLSEGTPLSSSPDGKSSEQALFELSKPTFIATLCSEFSTIPADMVASIFDDPSVRSLAVARDRCRDMVAFFPEAPKQATPADLTRLGQQTVQLVRGSRATTMQDVQETALDSPLDPGHRFDRLVDRLHNDDAQFLDDLARDYFAVPRSRILKLAAECDSKDELLAKVMSDHEKKRTKALRSSRSGRVAPPPTPGYSTFQMNFNAGNTQLARHHSDPFLPSSVPAYLSSQPLHVPLMPMASSVATSSRAASSIQRMGLPRSKPQHVSRKSSPSLRHIENEEKFASELAQSSARFQGPRGEASMPDAINEIMTAMPGVPTSDIMHAYLDNDQDVKKTIRYLQKTTGEGTTRRVSSGAMDTYKQSVLKPPRPVSVATSGTCRRYMTDKAGTTSSSSNPSSITPLASHDKGLAWSGSGPFSHVATEQLIEKRRELMAKSRNATRGKVPGVSSFYREEAQQITAELKRRDESLAATIMSAPRSTLSAASLSMHGKSFAESTSSQRFSNRDKYTLDLHGKTTLLAKEAVSRFIQEHKARRFNGEPATTLTIITGAGRNSAGGQAKIKPEIEKLLKMTGIRFSFETSGSLTINTKQFLK